MSKYDTVGSNENAYYPEDTDILINALDIHDPLELQETEEQLLENATNHFIQSINKIDFFDSELLNQIHKRFLSLLYPWAGQYRTVNMAKGDTHFANPQYIPKLMDDFDQKIKAENYLLGTETDVFIDHLAYFKCELIAIHPYREGNGRTIRLFCDLLALKNDFQPFDYPVDEATFVDRYMETSKQGVIHADYQPMATILRDAFRE